MAVTSFCATCQRTVYVADDDTAVCPVCATPLLQAIESRNDRAEVATNGAASDQTGGAK